jgi:regulator of sigma E protease
VSWVVVIGGFSLLILLHEFGHFAVAKLVGMQVTKFSLFFPPTLFSKKLGETEYAIGLIPAGGYVRITGMNPDENLPEEVRDRAYHAQPVWKRMAVIAAGPAMNVILAFLLLLVFFWQIGPRSVTDRVGAIQPGYPAAKALRKGDRILAVDGKRGSLADFIRQIGTHHCAGRQVNGCRAAKPATLEIERGGRRLTVKVTPIYDAQAKRARLGFAYAEGPRRPEPLGTAVNDTADRLWFITRETAKLPAYIFNDRKRREISGIVGTSDALNQTVKHDAGDVVALFAIISLSLAIINLFPFLPLDGGHIFWAAVEKVRRRPVPYAVMERAGALGFLLVLGLFLLGLSNDIGRLTDSTSVR